MKLTFEQSASTSLCIIIFSSVSAKIRVAEKAEPKSATTLVEMKVYLVQNNLLVAPQKLQIKTGKRMLLLGIREGFLTEVLSNDTKITVEEAEQEITVKTNIFQLPL